MSYPRSPWGEERRRVVDAVPCSFCGAEVGERCHYTGPNGGYRQHPHVERETAYVRAMQRGPREGDT